MQQLLFKQTYSLFLGWPEIVQTQYWNMGKGCGEIIRIAKDLHNSQKLRKVLATYKTNKLGLSEK